MSRMRNIKVVMFDLGNVIICFDHMIAAREISSYSDKTPQEIYDLFFYSQLTEKFDSGKIDEKEFFSRVKEILNLNGLRQDEFYNLWNNIFWENPGVSRLIADIKKRYEKFFIISNVNKPHFEYIREKFPVVREAEEIILSYEIGILKPDPRIYQLALQKAGCKPEEIFYTDDRPELVQAAKDMGFVAQVFKTIDEIREVLIV